VKDVVARCVLTATQGAKLTVLQQTPSRIWGGKQMSGERTDGSERAGQGTGSGRELKVKPLPSKNSGYGLDLVDLIVPRPGVKYSDLSITSPTPNHRTTKTAGTVGRSARATIREGAKWRR